jgi:hypothetical protein
MVDVSKTSPQEQASGDQFKKQDTKEEITLRVKELREQIDKHLEGNDVDPVLVERMNQIFNDVIAGIPPDPQIPIYQRATIATTMTKLKEQAQAIFASVNSKPEVGERFRSVFEEAEKKAKEEDMKKGTTQPGGPSQSQEQSRIRDQNEQAQIMAEQNEDDDEEEEVEDEHGKKSKRKRSR